MPVQEETFAHTFRGEDVYVQSQTGTGKTASFLVSIFHLMLHETKSARQKALIIVPTRELAVQIEAEAKLLGRYLSYTIGCLYGGIGYEKQKKLLEKNAAILIGTPGRLLDFYHQGLLHLNEIGILVIDEADRLFDMGFLQDVRKMIMKMPPPNQRITMLFSATLDYRVRELAWEYMNNPAEIKIEPKQVTVENITQELYHVSREEKMRLLLGIMEKEQPASALIFTNTKHEAVKVAKRLEHNGFPCEFLMGDLPQTKRFKIIEGIKSGKIRFLVATDVAARGLHINDLELVVNYDVPSQFENYVHRIGRTARAGKSGKAITLACDRYVFELEAIEAFINMKIPVVWATEDLFLKDESAGKSFAWKPDDFKENRRKNSSSPAVSSTEKTAVKTKTSHTTNFNKHNPNDKKPGQEKKPHKKSIGKHSTQQPLSTEGRMDYYRRKYGENFKVAAEKPAVEQKTPEAPVKRKSLFQKIVGVFAGRS